MERERDKIIQIFEKLIICLRDNTFDDLDAISTENISIEFSTVGRHEGINHVKKALAWDQKGINVRKAKAGNLVVRHNKTDAMLTGISYFLYAKDDSKGFYPVEFGGKFLLNLIKKEGIWLIRRILFDLDWTSGNTIFLPWSLIDHTRLMGHEQMIVTEVENPWLNFKNFNDDRTEEEKIMEIFEQYTMGEDSVNWPMLNDVLSDDASMVLTGQEVKGRKELLKFLRTKRFHEATWEHYFRYKDFKINENEASMICNRIEPHRLGTKWMHKQNVHGMYYPSTYRVDFIKEKKDWKIKRISFVGDIFFEDDNMKEVLVNK